MEEDVQLTFRAYAPMTPFREAFAAFEKEYDRQDDAGPVQPSIKEHYGPLMAALPSDHPLRSLLREAVDKASRLDLPFHVFEAVGSILRSP